MGDYFLLGCVGFGFCVAVAVGYGAGVVSGLVVVAYDWEMEMAR